MPLFQQDHEPDSSGRDGVSDSLTLELDHLRNIMISVATGGRRIDAVNADYRDRYARLSAQLRARGIQNPIPYADLWDWYGKWSSGDLPTYASRRQYIRGLFRPLETRLREGSPGRGVEVFAGPTGWPRVDRTIGEARSRLETASAAEQFQAVGLLCREALISLAQTVFDPDRHPPIDDRAVSQTDAKRMLERYLAVEVSGSSNACSRKSARASLDLANEVQHQRSADFRKAALCAEATASVINIIAILAGVRDPTDSGNDNLGDVTV